MPKGKTLAQLCIFPVALTFISSYILLLACRDTALVCSELFTSMFNRDPLLDQNKAEIIGEKR